MLGEQDAGDKAGHTIAALTNLVVWAPLLPPFTLCSQRLPLIQPSVPRSTIVFSLSPSPTIQAWFRGPS